MVLLICSSIFGSKINSWINSSVLERMNRSKGKGKFLETFFVVFLLSSPRSGTKLWSSETRHNMCIPKLTYCGKLEKTASYSHTSYSIKLSQCCFVVSQLLQNCGQKYLPIPVVHGKSLKEGINGKENTVIFPCLEDISHSASLPVTKGYAITHWMPIKSSALNETYICVLFKRRIFQVDKVMLW